MSKWISVKEDIGTVCPIFKKNFKLRGKLVSAKLRITSKGVYEAKINNQRVGDFILAPGFTSYHKRHQYQIYDVTDMLNIENEITVTIGNGWYCGYLAWEGKNHHFGSKVALAADIIIEYSDKTETISADETWEAAKSDIIAAEIYKGEKVDARIIPEYNLTIETANTSAENLIPQEGEFVKEQEHIKPINIFVDPNGETIVDFGQNMTGYVQFSVSAHSGDIIEYSHAEILDKEGNFYNRNLRTADQKITYICRDGEQTYKPHHTFMGFRYIRLEKSVPGVNFTAIVVHSQMERTGYFHCGNEKINKLYSNIIWGQKSNFLDIPTDCPQRDERLGWTGDAQVFIKTASYNYNVEKFFVKWLRDLMADQLENGSIPHVIPDILHNSDGSAAWGDAAVICPWQLYLTYGNKDVLAEHFESMKKWVDFSIKPDRFHFGDWLALDEPENPKDIDPNMSEDEKHKGNSNQHLISDAFNLYSTALLIKAGKVIGKDIGEYEEIYKERVAAFNGKYKLRTQTEFVLPIFFNLSEDKQKLADKLNQMIIDNENRLQTGFVGTPYLLHTLSENGHTDTAYNLLLQEAYPSWLFSVNNGATTIWEHWDGVRADGSITDACMNSYNHYAYGSVADWMYSVVCGIRIDESAPAFENVILKPIPDKRLGNAEATVITKYGLLYSKWEYISDCIKYEFIVPNKATIIINDESIEVSAGKYKFERAYKKV